MIQAEGLCKRYGAIEAARGVDLAIARGETFGLLGPNGAGKTTTILMLVGAVVPDAGRVAIDDHDVREPDVRRRIGIAPQELAIYDELSAEENLRFFARLYRLSGDRLRERVSWGLAFAGLTDRRTGRAGTFSGGMKRRLNLACAAVHEPAFLVLDEPTVGVDPQSRNHIFESIEALARDGCTILYTTHYMEEAERLCSRVAIMDQGRVMAIDTVAALVAEHGGPAVERVQIERPDLEHVFLRLTGRSLRD